MNKTLSAYIRRAVFERDNHTCQYCGRCGEAVELEIDHIIPVSRGGNNDMRNLITACRECNRAKHNRLLSADELFEIAEKINSSLEYLMSLASDGTSNASKFSLCVKDENLREDLGRLALLDGVSLTELVSKALQGYVATRTDDIEFMRHQEQERRDRRSKHDG